MVIMRMFKVRASCEMARGRDAERALLARLIDALSAGLLASSSSYLCTYKQSEARQNAQRDRRSPLASLIAYSLDWPVKMIMLEYIQFRE